METTLELQRWLYASAIGALNGLRTAGLTGLPPLIAAAFGFGMLHALLPGHGKSVLAAYYAGDGRWRGALASSVILIVTHVGSAVLFVLTVSLSFNGQSEAPAVLRCWSTRATSLSCCQDSGFCCERYDPMCTAARGPGSSLHS